MRRIALGDDDRRRLEEVALDPARPDGQRLRAHSLLRRARWAHLSLVLRARASAAPPLHIRLDAELATRMTASSHIARGPSETQREVISALLGELDPAWRRSIESILRMAA